MRQLTVAIVLIIAIALQSALRAVWQPLGFVDFTLVLVVYFALQREPLPALITAAVAGLALDLISRPPALLGAGRFAQGVPASAVFFVASQNLRIRLRLIQALVLLLLSVLCVRLYLLQIVNGAHYAEIAENQRIRLLPIPAPRGAILDRAGTQLVDSRPIYSVILSREVTKSIDYSLIKPLSDGLQLDSEILRERFDQVKSQPAFESIPIKEGATPADIAWVDAHQLELPTLRIEQTPQRRYPENGLLCHVLGYVGEISPEQLKQPEYRDKGYKPGDIIGQEGLESVYDEYLRGRDGYRKVIVDSRGHIQNEVERVEPQSGQDIVITIDLDLQKAAEEQLRKSPQGRGVIISMDPNNGEVLALASAPTFDPNLFSQRITTKEGRAE